MKHKCPVCKKLTKGKDKLLMCDICSKKEAKKWIKAINDERCILNKDKMLEIVGKKEGKMWWKKQKNETNKNKM